MDQEISKSFLISGRNTLIFSQLNKSCHTSIYQVSHKYFTAWGLSVICRSWAKSTTRMIEIPPDSTFSLPVIWCNLLSIQPHMFCPITKIPSIIYDLTPWNKIWPLISQQFLSLLSNFKSDCSAISSILNVAMPKDDKTIQ